MEIVMLKVNSSQAGACTPQSTLHTHMLMSYVHTHTNTYTPE